jgi:hypothetical protein
VNALAVYDNSTMWPLKVEKRKATAAAAPRSHKKKRCRFFDLMYPQFLEMEENALQSSCSVYICDDEREGKPQHVPRRAFFVCHHFTGALGCKSAVEPKTIISASCHTSSANYIAFC